MSTLIASEGIVIPPWVVDFESYRRWAQSDEFPERGRICFLSGAMWIDPTMEKVKHNRVKGQYATVLDGLVNAADSGMYFHDRFALVYPSLSLVSEPDGMFASWKTLRSGRARLLGDFEDCKELEGTPDMALEVVSTGSVEKDTVILFQSYWDAGIPEYWLVDVREDRLRFDIFKHGPDGYIATRPRDGWVKSKVFGKAFRLTQRTDRLGNPAYRLSSR